MPNRATFTIRPIRERVLRLLSESRVSVDIFARNNRLATHTNDLSRKTEAEHHLKAPEFLALMERMGVVADLVLFDPPFSARQMKECYASVGLPFGKKDAQNARLYRECRAGIRRITSPGSRVLACGWNSTGMGPGWQIEEIVLVPHGAAHNDTICVIHRRMAP